MVPEGDDVTESTPEQILADIMQTVSGPEEAGATIPAATPEGEVAPVQPGVSTIPVAPVEPVAAPVAPIAPVEPVAAPVVAPVAPVAPEQLEPGVTPAIVGQPGVPSATEQFAREAEIRRVATLEAENNLLKSGRLQPEVAGAGPAVPVVTFQAPAFEATPADVQMMQDKPAEFITAIVNHSVDMALQAIGQQLGSHVPQMITEHLGRMTNEQSQMRTLADQFYRDNPDLAPHGELVGMVSTDVQARNPNASKAELMPVIAQRTRAIMGAGMGTAGVPLVPSPAAVLPGSRDGLVPANGAQNDIEQTLDFKY